VNDRRNRELIEDECWNLADAYRDACVARARADALLAGDPKDTRLRDERFDAGMRQSHAWDCLRERTRDLMAIAGLPAAAEIRQAAVKQGSDAGIRAFRSAMQEAGADAA
jgi:hypothetical protein